jgi:uncharacterized protein
MNRRQRKKARLGEFIELGFELTFALPSAWSDADTDGFSDRAIDKIESLGLSVGGGTGHVWDVFVTAFAPRTSVTESQRQALLNWLNADPAVSALRVGPLSDAWRPSDHLDQAS